MKKLLALVLTMVMCLSIMAGCQQDPVSTNPPETTAPPQTTAPVSTTAPTEPEPTEYTFPAGAKLDVYPQGISGELSAHPLNGFIEDATGLDIEWKAFAESGGIMSKLTEKVTPSLVASSHTSIVNEYGRYGAFVNLWDYQDIMPNFFARFLQEDRQQYRDVYMISEDELYCAPIFTNGSSSYPGFLVREDIMKELNLEAPTDWDSFYAILKAMKEKYPDSYPFTMRNMGGTLGGIEHICRMFGVNFFVAGKTNSCLRLDRETGKYYESLATDEARDMLRKLNQLVEEELMDPACLGYNTSAWLEAMSSGHAFITVDPTWQYDNIENAGKAVNPAFDLTWWTCFPMVETELDPYFAPTVPLNNWAITTRCPDVELACRFLDWLYTDEAVEIMCWGVEGVSYEVDADGTKSYIEGFDTSLMAKATLCGEMDFLATLQTYSQEAKDMIVASSAASEISKVEVDPLLVYDEAGQFAWDTYAVGYSDVRATHMQKFILGEYDIDDDAAWQAYKDALAAQGQAEQIAAAEAAYAALQG